MYLADFFRETVAFVLYTILGFILFGCFYAPLFECLGMFLDNLYEGFAISETAVFKTVYALGALALMGLYATVKIAKKLRRFIGRSGGRGGDDTIYYY